MDEQGGDMTDEKKQNDVTQDKVYDFGSLNLQVGSRLQFSLTGRGSKPVQYFTTLIGYVKDEYLIAKIPLENGEPLGLRDGEQVSVRVFSGVNVCSFTASVDHIFLHPCFYFHLSFPRLIQGTSLRKAMRVRVRIPGQVVEIDGAVTAHKIPMLISNLSVAGALLESDHELGNSEGTVGICFTLVHEGSEDVKIEANGKICNVNVRKAETAGQRDLYTYGIEFIDLDHTQKIMLQNMTYEALIADRQKIV